MMRRLPPWLARQLYVGTRRAGTVRPPRRVTLTPPSDPWLRTAETVTIPKIGGRGDG